MTSQEESSTTSSSLPPWLYRLQDDEDNASSSSFQRRKLKAILEEELLFFQWELEALPLPPEDVSLLLHSLPRICRSNLSWMLGCLDFLQTILKLDPLLLGNNKNNKSHNNNDNNDADTTVLLLASMVHYVDCIVARTEGIYDRIQERIMMNQQHHTTQRLLEPAKLEASSHQGQKIENEDTAVVVDVVDSKNDKMVVAGERILVEAEVSSTETALSDEQITSQSIILEDEGDIIENASEDRRRRKRLERRKQKQEQKERLEQEQIRKQEEDITSASSSVLVKNRNVLSQEALELSNSASHIKRAEIVAEVVLPRQIGDYEKVQNLLVSVSGDDWRALAIRCVASLYRLEGILQQSFSSASKFVEGEETGIQRLPEAIANARAAMHIYAPLAQRMGLHPLKMQLESKAFQILYPRQYKAAWNLFRRQGDSMNTVSRYLQQQIWHLLQQDPNIQHVDLQVKARVKEPFSFWKKLLRKTVTGRDRHSTTASLVSGKSHPRSSVVMRFDSELSRQELQSVLKVRDGVALRVILQTPRQPGESKEQQRTRDQFMCYYVHQLIRSVFPETHPGRVKDYIQNPKPNGYQSLHHTSVIHMDQFEIPFEVQVRSQEMHRVAEFGVAAHWDYKKEQRLVPTGLAALPPSDEAIMPLTDHPLLSSSSSASAAAPAANLSCDQQKDGKMMQSAGKNASSETLPYLQALEVARQSLVKSSVFVFVAGTEMEHGQLVSVSRGERIVNVWHQVSEGAVKVWKNGKLADIESEVQNGDVLLFEQQQEEETSPLSRRTSKRKKKLAKSASKI